MVFQLEGANALVTGANRGIGLAIVQALLERGAAKVYAAVRNVESVSQLVAAHRGRIVALELDLAKAETVEAAAMVATDVQLVINNAGVFRSAPLLTAEAEEAFRFELDVNAFGLLRVARAFGIVLKHNGGVLVQVNSVVSLRNAADFATYSASKAAAYSLTQALRDTFNAQGIRVMSVHPGPVLTDMGQAAGLASIAEPPSVVAYGLIKGLESGAFHVFPGNMAGVFWAGYEAFARAFVESTLKLE